jgi:HNH endonuclease
VILSAAIKKKVCFRAGDKCEYCLLPQKFSFYQFHIDHIISLKHGGSSEIDNLAYCCPDCNSFKGTDLATFLLNSNNLIRFFNPRKDSWDDHFEISDSLILGKTEIGSATEKIFQFNEIDRLIFRRELIRLQLY